MRQAFYVCLRKSDIYWRVKNWKSCQDRPIVNIKTYFRINEIENLYNIWKGSVKVDFLLQYIIYTLFCTLQRMPAKTFFYKITICKKRDFFRINAKTVWKQLKYSLPIFFVAKGLQCSENPNPACISIRDAFYNHQSRQ